MFFKRGGNRGFFPDPSIEEERSLFQNDDECCTNVGDDPSVTCDPVTTIILNP